MARSGSPLRFLVVLFVFCLLFLLFFFVLALSISAPHSVRILSASLASAAATQAAGSITGSLIGSVAPTAWAWAASMSHSAAIANRPYRLRQHASAAAIANARTGTMIGFFNIRQPNDSEETTDAALCGKYTGHMPQQ